MSNIQFITRALLDFFNERYSKHTSHIVYDSFSIVTCETVDFLITVYCNANCDLEFKVYSWNDANKN